jgi:hypothetical protein
VNIHFEIRTAVYEIKPGQTAGAPAPACVANLSLGFFGTVFVGYLVYPKISKLYFEKKV